MKTFTITIENGVAVDNGVSHDIAIRNKTNKKGEDRNRMVFKDNAGFIRVVAEGTTEVPLNVGIKGFSWLANVPMEEFTPIYAQMATLFEKYGDFVPSSKSNEDLLAEQARLQKKMDRLMALLHLQQ